MKTIPAEKLCGVWSASPTPFDQKMNIDLPSIRRMVDHHVRMGVKGLFLAGTNGEGPWLTDRKRRDLVRAVAEYSAGRLVLAVQVTDNSAERIVENMRAAKEDGADIAVIAPPYMLMNATDQNVIDLYSTAIADSPLPVGIYDRGRHSQVPVSDKALAAIYACKNVILVKDSSCDAKRMALALAARKKRPALRLLDGDEFHCVQYLRAGYDGLLLGGGVFNGLLAGQIVQAAADGQWDRAERLQNRMNRIMWAVYGGKKIKCWLTGEKKLLVDMGIFSTANSYLRYPLTPACRKAIARVLRTNAKFLFPD